MPLFIFVFYGIICRYRTQERTQSMRIPVMFYFGRICKMKLTVRTSAVKSYVEIPVEFFDEYMPSAPDGALKVYLYLLRCSCDPSIRLSLSDIADLFDMTSKSIIRSLTYWEECGLLSFVSDGDELTEITLFPFHEMTAGEVSLPEDDFEEEEDEKPSEEPVRPAPQNIHALPVRQDPEAASALEALIPDLDRDETFLELLDLAQYYLKRPLTSVFRDTLGYCYLLFDRQADVITYLLEYCIEQGHSSVHYIRSVAEGWKGEGLDTLSAIRSARMSRSKTVTDIQKAFGIRDRALGKVEMDYIAGWSRDFELPIILEACNRTMEKAHAPSFSYANKILSDWKDAGVRSMDDIAKLDASHAEKGKKAAARNTSAEKPRRNSFRNFEERSDDYSDLIKNYYES